MKTASVANPARAFGALLALGALASAPAARAQSFQVVATPSAPPIANAVTQYQASSVSFNATNTRANTRVRRVTFTVPTGYTIQGGAGPTGWAMTRITTGGRRTIRFQVVDCNQQGIPSGSTGTFRLDVTPATVGNITADVTDHLWTVTPADPCGGPTGWSTPPQNSVAFQRKALSLTASAAPLNGPSPLATTVSFTVSNQSSAAQANVAVAAPTVTASPAGASYTATPCTPATVSLAARGSAGATATVTCGFTLTAPAGSAASFAFASTASNAASSAVGARAGPVTVGPATATFALDKLNAGPGETVVATLSVTNNTAATITVTPPGFAALSLTNLQKLTGATDPPAVQVAAGARADFDYSLAVTGQPGASYLASGTAQTSAGATNLATTPAGIVAGSRVDWTPPAVVKSRTASPYPFTVRVTNNTAVNVVRVEVVNPQNNLWIGLADAGGSTPLTYQTKLVNGTTDTLRYGGTLAPGATATVNVGFTTIPTETATVSYGFQVRVYFGTTSTSVTFEEQVDNTVPIDDVAGLSILSNATGQTLWWANTSRPDEEHDGVVVFRKAAPGVPSLPADFVDYTQTPVSDLLYADRDGSTVAGLSDASPGAWNYRVCNHDANFVYSHCNAGFWNNAGWLDSVAAPAGGWAHALGGALYLYPGLLPGSRIGIASNAPAVSALTTSNGQRAFDPIKLLALPSSATPAATLGNGLQALLAADNAGVATAIDLQAGTIAWSATKAGESFVAGVGGALRQYAAPAFQAAYNTDVLFLGSTSGRLLAVDARTGATLWTLAVGPPIGATSYYDASSNWLFVHTDGGVRAYDLSTSTQNTPPSPAAGWVNPGGAYGLACVRRSANELACIDKSGLVSVLDKATGAVHATLATGLSLPSSLWNVAAAPSGLVVGNGSAVQRLTVTGTPATAISTAGSWNPGLTLSPLQVFQAEGFIYLGASDLRLHKLRLADAGDTALTVSVSPQAPSTLAPMVYDVASQLFLFGSSDGHLWAVPPF
jgi:hypothetical protein